MNECEALRFSWFYFLSLQSELLIITPVNVLPVFDLVLVFVSLVIPYAYVLDKKAEDSGLSHQCLTHQEAGQQKHKQKCSVVSPFTSGGVKKMRRTVLF